MSRQAGPPAGPRRLPAIALVALVLALAGVANATLHHHQSADRLASVQDQSVARVSSKVTSAAWYCAGPLPVGTRNEASSLAVANAGPKQVSGELVVATNDGRNTVTPFSIGRYSQGVYGLMRSGRAAFAAATVLVNGAGVGVEELVHGPTGPVSSPCVSHASMVGYVAAGSTENASNLALALYDPGATPAVVNVSFATGAGRVAPPTFQGISLSAGQLQVVDVGHYLPARPVVATTVSATGGKVVAGALLVAANAKSVESTLLDAVTAPRSAWSFSAAPAGGAVRQLFSVLDPGKVAARIVLHLATSSGSSALAETVPAGGIVHLAPSPEVSPVAMRYATVTSADGVGVVVAREALLVGRVVPSAPKAVKRTETVRVLVHGRVVTRRQVVTVTSRSTAPAFVGLPQLEPGYAATSAVAEPGTTWLIAGGESDRHASELLTVADPGDRPARIVVHLLASSGKAPTRRTPVAQLSGLTVPAHGEVTFSLAALPALKGELPLEVSATSPVLAAGELYARGSTSALGFSSPAAIPVR
ncbi:MAG TPA: DUF5719 family protein [Acidimicrobiales bacterium]|nr:DUF5719 family protein [Acidimicrobiales bacterium]